MLDCLSLPYFDEAVFEALENVFASMSGRRSVSKLAFALETASTATCWGAVLVGRWEPEMASLSAILSALLLVVSLAMSAVPLFLGFSWEIR